jgi:hypothetical protein
MGTRISVEDNDPAYVCKECGESFIPQDGDWPALKAIHIQDCRTGEGRAPGFTKTTVGNAF